jgi:hypothetical protein
VTASRDTEVNPEAARREAIALYGEEVVAASEAAFDASCRLNLALRQTTRRLPDGPRDRPDA